MNSKFKTKVRRLRVEFRDLIELFIVPCMAALLPWPICFRFFRWITRYDFLYRSNWQSAVIQFHGHYPETTPGALKAWCHQRRLVTLIDHADLYLSLTRSNQWMRKYLDQDGSWPSPSKAGILCTFHWGAGMWGLRHAHESGLQVHALVAALEGSHFRGRSMLHTYAKLRTSEVSKVLGKKTLDVSSSLRPVIKALKQCEQVLAAVDVPPDQVSHSFPVNLLNTTIWMPRGLLRVAAEQNIPVTVYVTGIDFKSGRRKLNIIPINQNLTIEILGEKVFENLNKSMIKSSSSWHFWQELKRFKL